MEGGGVLRELYRGRIYCIEGVVLIRMYVQGGRGCIERLYIGGGIEGVLQGRGYCW